MLKLLKKLSIPTILLCCVSASNSKVGTTPDYSENAKANQLNYRLSIPIMTRVVAGNRVYYVRLRIGDGPETNVILDTGSIGLRVISAVVPNRAKNGRPIIYHFESGSELHGSVSNENISAGGHLLGTVPVQVVDKLRCTSQVPACAVARLDPSTPFAQGIDGRSNQEFGAIMGIRLFARDRAVPNPLRAAGFKLWVVKLPLRDGEQGALTLGVSPTELSNFTRIAVDTNGSLTACLDSSGATQLICLPTVLDTGDPHVFVYLQNVKNQVLPANMPMKLVFANTLNAGQKVVVEFTSAKNQDKESQEALRYNPNLVSLRQLKNPQEPPYINSGYLPFLDYLIYFDADEQVIGMRARPR
ncbi:hypothetical protein [Rahnella aceris]|jgi:hypothetical protein|uniref:Peptidase A2 domain-containing protein n=1 Tax=Rahnella sp. (strain Y9602) TaxID=2703885 RepID=A0A0H3FHU0_RAHSY|nr:hypothetical protein [Rahnella aceris]ADW76714.1 hypothetical protein Rahaq_5148 [Rahnella aceris]AFE61288.1 hypothetical protein Q7S_25691 [Rahnella aquatilis HX2]